MKITKKILAVAVAVAGLSLMGCPMPLGDGLISSTGVVNYTSDEQEGVYARDFSQLAQKHEDYVVRITLENANEGPGVMGAAFDMTQNDDGSWNFGLVGIRRYNGKNQFYVSHYFNTSKEEWSDKNFGAYNHSTGKDITKNAYDPNTTTPYEVVVVALPDSSETLTSSMCSYSNEEGLSCVVLIQTTNQCGYNINIVKPETWDNATGTKAEKFNLLVSDSMRVASISNTVTGYKDVSTDPNNPDWRNPAGKKDNIVSSEPGHIEAKVGYYVNIYPKKSMYGSFDKLYTTGEPIAE